MYNNRLLLSPSKKVIHDPFFFDFGEGESDNFL